MNDYRVNLEIYNGPLDLLLYLIRRDEVDIYDIPIANITEQYIGYVDMLQELDPNIAGDFLVLAATLMEIKTRMLLPAQSAEEGAEDDELHLDPRAELVRQLLEYKAFKDAAGDLRDVAEMQSQKFPRKPANIEFDDDATDLEDVQVWNLFDAFSKIMEEIGQRKTQHEVIYDDTPVELHAEDLMDRLNREGAMTFRRIFEGLTSRSEVVGLFLAMLELVRQKKIFATQDDNFGEIHVHANPNPPAEDEEIISHEMDRRPDEPEDDKKTPGRYVPAPHAEQDEEEYSDDDDESDDEDNEDDEPENAGA